jgi:ComF family protein
MLDWLYKIPNFLLPQACLLCKVTLKQQLPVCKHCLRSLPWFLQQKHCLFHYQPPIDYCITQLKFSGQLAYAKFFGHILSKKLALAYRHQVLPQCIIPVPLHTTRMRTRGFNQSLEIARFVARELSIPIDTHSCERHKATQTQSLLPAKKRQANLHQAFRLIQQINYSHVAILDDVITTGSTINTLRELLLSQGVSQVDVWSCAKACYE